MSQKVESFAPVIFITFAATTTPSATPIMEVHGCFPSSNKNLQIDFETNDITEAYINADIQRIRQLLINLIVNSIKYSKKGIITIKLKAIDISNNKDRSWQVSIIDQGIGIPETDLDSVFEPYFQVNATNSIIPSFGYGLSLCKKIVEAHGGTIKATNNSDKGVTFSFCVPMLI